MDEVTIKVQGMTCGGCARNLTKTLEALPGVSAANVSLEQANATVRYDPNKLDITAIRQAVENAGFDAPQ